jgi:hypothetical protein
MTSPIWKELVADGCIPLGGKIRNGRINWRCRPPVRQKNIASPAGNLNRPSPCLHAPACESLDYRLGLGRDVNLRLKLNSTTLIGRSSL